ncbi:PREDICTED: MHC class I polypeptide-related sequence A [Elephantulus edwardii]|uniref:MHC class I polypeptide-related sequence A n=1 Tax=Elephantulus edwardii TaxID=28737 RepID=UPI0003F0A3F1|nr:PREDICTED: MHC class I polypeptide-related sequence A [Elephantulus edwardii]
MAAIFLSSSILFLFLNLADGLLRLRLHYAVKVWLWDGSVQPHFIVNLHQNGKLVMQYDSEKGQAEPLDPWAHVANKNWEKEIKDFEEMSKNLRMTVAEILKLDDQKRGLHSLQEMRGCEIMEDNTTRAFWEFCLNGEPFLSYDPETLKWMELSSSSQAWARKIKESWDKDENKHKDYSHHVEAEACEKLRNLATWRDFTERTVSPVVNVSHINTTADSVTLKCQASGFYPRNISLTWLQDGDPLSSQDSQFHGCVLPHANGTYETWVSIKVPHGKEQKYSCRVEHNGKKSTHPETLGLHSLLYEVRVDFQHESVQQQFFTEEYVDGKHILHYDSEKDQAEPQGRWAEAFLRNKAWNTEIIDLKEMGKNLRMTVADSLNLEGPKEGEMREETEEYEACPKGRELRGRDLSVSM